MPPVTLKSLAPHPYLPFQPSKSQFIIPPQDATSHAPPGLSTSDKRGEATFGMPKNILAAAKAGNLEWIKRYSAAGQTEMADNMGEVPQFTDVLWLTQTNRDCIDGAAESM